MSTPFLFVPIFRAFDTAGNPLSGGLLYTYAAGTTSQLATYSDAGGTVQNANPVVLDTTGSATVRLGNSAYKFVLKDAGGSTQWTEDNYQPVGDGPSFSGTTTLGTLVVTASATVQSNLTVDGTSTLQGQVVANSGMAIIGDTVGRGIAVAKTKASDTARLSTVTLTADADLAYAIPAIGTYEIEAFLVFDSVAAGAGFKYGYTFSGTQTQNIGLETGNVNSAIVGPVSAGGLVGSSIAFSTVATGASGNFVRVVGNLLVTVVGTFSIVWAQNSSTASNTKLRAGSYLKVTGLT